MANIELVIKIPEIEYEYITNGEKFNSLEKGKREWLINKTLNYVLNGTPLPKGHVRLIDADDFIKTMEDASERQKYKKLLIDDLLTVDDVFKAVIESLQNKGLAEGDAPTIIDADKESD